MKRNFVFVIAVTCIAISVSSALAGGHGQGARASNIGMQSLTGSVSAPSGGPIGGYVPPQTPLPPLHAPPTLTNTSALVPTGGTSTGSTATGKSPLGEPVFLIPSSISTASAAPSQAGNGRVRVSPTEKVSIPEKPTVSGGSSHSTNFIFTPPPTIVPQQGQRGGIPANLAGNSLAERAFQSSILNTNLQTGSSGQSQPNPAPWIRITPLQYNGPTVQVPTSSATSAGH